MELPPLSNIVFFKKIIDFLYYLKNRNFNNKRLMIEYNIAFHKKISAELKKYVEDRSNGDIGLRLIYWNNYPDDTDNNAFNHLLNIKYLNNKKIQEIYIDHSGIFFRQDIWFEGQSLHIDKDDIYFFFFFFFFFLTNVTNNIKVLQNISKEL